MRQGGKGCKGLCRGDGSGGDGVSFEVVGRALRCPRAGLSRLRASICLRSGVPGWRVSVS